MARDQLFGLLSSEEDVCGVESLPSHHLPLEEAPDAYRMFAHRQDGCIKVVLKP